MNDKQSTKDNILEAAKELFVSKGFNATTIREIADEAGVNSALIQYHFQGKQGLLIEIASELFEGELEYFTEALEGDLASAEEMQMRLNFYLDMVILRGLKKWKALKIVISESYELSQIKKFKYSNHSELSLKNLERFLMKAKKKSIIAKEVNVPILADNLMCLVIDQVLNWQMNKLTRQQDISDKTTRKNWLSHTLNTFFSGIMK